MSVKRIALTAAAAFVMAAPAMADGGPSGPVRSYYVEAEGGIAFSGDLDAGCCTYNMDSDYNVGGAVGMFLDPNIAVEFDVFDAKLGYAGFDADISGLGLMIDALYNFNVGMVDPYVGVGAGTVRVHFREGGDSGSDWKFGYQLMGGLMLNVSDMFGFFAEYRFQDAVGDAHIDGTDFEYQSHNVSGGIRASF